MRMEVVHVVPKVSLDWTCPWFNQVEEVGGEIC